MMRNSVLLLCFLTACTSAQTCTQDTDCDDGNVCTKDSCQNGSCLQEIDPAGIPEQQSSTDCVRQICQGTAEISIPDDGEIPIETSPSDCLREACANGQIITIAADNEVPVQTGAACLQEICIGGGIRGIPAASNAGGCGGGEYCDADAGCQANQRDLLQAPGVVITGNETGAQLTNFTGLSLADLDGDGFSDLAISAPDVDVTVPVTRQGAGKVFVLSGPVETNNALENALVISGAEANARTGLAVTSCDLNGDLFADLAIAAPGASTNGVVGAGKVFGIFGPLQHSLDLASLETNSDGFVLFGDTTNEQSPDRLLCQDLNRDGIADLVLGAERRDAQGRADAGEVFVFLGGDTLFGQRPFGAADLTIEGHSPQMHLGGALGAADLDGDGGIELVMGAPRIGANQLRSETVILLSSTQLFDKTGQAQERTIDLASTSLAFFVSGGNREQFGFSFTTADFNRDLLDDLAIGALLSDPSGRSNAGEVDVLYGSATLSNLSVDQNGNQFTRIIGFDAGDEFGISLSAGDHNGDGFPDLLVGAHTADGFGNARQDSGESFLFLGKENPLPFIDLRSTAPGLVIFGRDSFSNSGKLVLLGRLNQDEKADLLIAAPEAASAAGQIFLIQAP